MFPAEGCVQVSSRRQRVAFSRAEIGFCRVLLSSIVNKLGSQRYGFRFSISCLVYNDILCFCSDFVAIPSNEGSI